MTATLPLRSRKPGAKTLDPQSPRSRDQIGRTLLKPADANHRCCRANRSAPSIPVRLKPTLETARNPARNYRISLIRGVAGPPSALSVVPQPAFSAPPSKARMTRTHHRYGPNSTNNSRGKLPGLGRRLTPDPLRSADTQRDLLRPPHAVGTPEARRL